MRPTHFQSLKIRISPPPSHPHFFFLMNCLNSDIQPEVLLHSMGQLFPTTISFRLGSGHCHTLSFVSFLFVSFFFSYFFPLSLFPSPLLSLSVRHSNLRWVNCKTPCPSEQNRKIRSNSSKANKQNEFNYQNAELRFVKRKKKVKE